jgi:hypothetical protein
VLVVRDGGTVTDLDLPQLGLRAGDRVRWRPRPNRRWVEGTVTGRERDGSVGVRDGGGRARALPFDRLEVRTTGPRGAYVWEPVARRAQRGSQMDLFGEGAPATATVPTGQQARLSPPASRRSAR